MKKFLTVLLALSVVFTYTVGTAFAADTTNPVPQTTTDAVKAQMKFVENYAENWAERKAINNFGGSGLYGEAGLLFYQVPDTSYEFEQTGTVKLANLVVDEARKEIEDIAKDATSEDDKVAEIKACAQKYYGDDAADTFDDCINGFDLSSLELKFAKEWFINYVAVNFDDNDYSDILGDDGLSDREKVIELKDNAMAALDKVNSLWENATNKKDIYYVAYNFLTNMSKYQTIDQMEESNKTLAEQQAYYLSDIKAKLDARKAEIKSYVITHLATDNKITVVGKEILERVDADFDAVYECAEYTIENSNVKNVEANYRDFISDCFTGYALGYDWNNGDVRPTLAKYVGYAKTVADLKALASEMKAKTGFNGAPLYDADEVDTALEADIEAVYSGTYTDGKSQLKNHVLPHEDLVKAEMNRVLNSNAKPFLVNGKAYVAVKDWESTDYDDEKLAEVKSIVADTKAAIRAAKTVEAVDEAFIAGYTKFAAVPTAKDLEKFQKTAEAKATKKMYEAKLNADLVSKKANYKGNFDTDFDVNYDGLVRSLSEKYLKEAYTVEEMADKYAEAAAEIANLKTAAELTAEAASINEDIKALPVLRKVTIDDEDAILAVNKRVADFTAYKTLIGADGYYNFVANVGEYMDAVKVLAKEELKKAYAAIGTVTVEDEAAIDEFAAKVKAYDDNYTPASDYADEVEQLYIDLNRAKVAAVAKAIGAIDASADPLDVAAIEAARAAYDALGEYGIGLDSTMYHKLLSLENLAREYAIKAVEGMKVVKCHSAAGKGYIKVMWEAVGDENAIDGFQVYKSTKAQSGYTFMGKTTKHYMTNKKGLKKGKRFYYKVRAYKVIDGTKYFSDWSNKANRIAK